MKKAAVAIAVAALAGMGSAVAQDYQIELGASYTDINPDVGSGDSTLAFGGTYHLNRVKTAGHPLAEAGFLQRSSNLSAGYATTDKADVDGFGIGGEFYLTQLYLRGEYIMVDAAGTDVDTLSGRIGLMLSDSLRLAAGINRVDVDTPGTDALNHTVLEAKYVSKMAGGTALNLEGDLTFFDDGGSGTDVVGLNLSGDYYLNPMTSLGLSYFKVDSDAAAGDSDDFGIDVSHFFTPTFAGALEYRTASDGDADVITAAVTLRF
jgi:hypothetical protein